MNCPECGGKTRVEDTKGTENKVWRRRKCRSCGHKMHSYETTLDSVEEILKDFYPEEYTEIMQAIEIEFPRENTRKAVY